MYIQPAGSITALPIGTWSKWQSKSHWV